jgi:hypothetical protein
MVRIGRRYSKAVNRDLEVLVAAALEGVEQGFDLASQRLVVASGIGKESATLFRGPVEGLVEETLHLVPPFWGHRITGSSREGMAGTSALTIIVNRGSPYNLVGRY